jgi:bacillithiol system protein YtxJ
MPNVLTDRAHAERLLTGDTQAWLFKHSATCPISHAAHEEVAAHLAAHPGEAAGMVVVQDDRPLSNWLAERLGRVHQSPQLFLVRGGAVLWDASHWSITAAAMAAAAARARSA